MISKLILPIMLILLTGCQARWAHPTKSTAAFQRDSSHCKYESEKYGHVAMWDSGIGAGIEEGLRKNKLYCMCMQQRGWKQVWK